jgi:hypothetical protein
MRRRNTLFDAAWVGHPPGYEDAHAHPVRKVGMDRAHAFA